MTRAVSAAVRRGRGKPAQCSSGPSGDEGALRYRKAEKRVIRIRDESLICGVV